MTRKKEESKTPEIAPEADKAENSEAEGIDAETKEEPLLIEYFSKYDLLEKIKSL